MSWNKENWAANGPTVNSSLGTIHGKSIDAQFKGTTYNVNLFAGIPYAKPPVGKLRFKKPIPFGKLNGLPFNASEFASACPQRDWSGMGLYSDNEDCLYLNIYVPTDGTGSNAANTDEKLAVMIYIHGGGFSRGASNKYTAQVLSAVGNVVVVTINYRLGLLGFANTGDGRIPGNMGLWDQRLAFQWVHDNIADFRGDPSKVTLFGESAGSVSVFLHGLYPENQGLFQNIIGGSGSPTIPYYPNNVPALKIAAEALGCDTTLDEIVTCLQTADAHDLVSKLEGLSTSMMDYLKFRFIPGIDGEYIKRDYYTDLVIKSKTQSVPEIDFFRSLNLITGMNSEEGALFLFMLGQDDLETVTVSSADFRAVNVPSIFSLLVNVNQLPVPGALLDLIAHEYTDWSNTKEFRNMYMKLMADLFFNFHGREAADIHANTTDSNTYFYSFDANVNRSVLPTPSWVDGANHMDELLSVFGYGLDSYVPDDVTTPDWELDMAERVMAYWSNFAKTGNPNGNAGQSTNNLPTWPQLEVGQPAYISFDRQDEIRHDDLYGREIKFWREIVPSAWLAMLDTSVCNTSGGSADTTNGAETGFTVNKTNVLLQILLSCTIYFVNK